VSQSRRVALVSAGNALPAIVGLVTAPVLAQALGVDGRGELAAATTPLLLLLNAATLGLPDALTYFLSQNRSDSARILKRALCYLALAGIIGTLAIAAFSLVLQPGNPDLRMLMIIAAFALAPSLVVAGLRGAASGQQRWGLVTVERSIGAVARLVALVTLAGFSSLDVLTATIAIAVSPLLGVLAYIPLSRTISSSSPQVSPSERPLLLSYGMRVWIGSFAGIILARIDQLLMIPLSSLEQLGLYAVAVTVSEAALVFNATVREVLFAAESRTKATWQKTASAARISTFVTLLIALVIGLASIWAVPVLFGKEFSPAVPVVQMLLLAVVVGNPGSVAGASLSARGHPELRSYSLLIACVINVVAVLLLVPALGAMGAAISTLTGNVVSSTLNIYWLRVRAGARMRSFYGFRIEDAVQLKMHAISLFRRK
jgi:O-antigen/teichoic acid export membrane protein